MNEYNIEIFQFRMIISNTSNDNMLINASFWGHESFLPSFYCMQPLVMIIKKQTYYNIIVASFFAKDKKLFVKNP